MRMSSTALALTLVLGAATAHAAPVLYDFESTPATGVSTGGYASLSLTESGLTMVVTGSASNFDVVDNTAGQAGKPASWGLRSLSPFVHESGDPFILDFSAAIGSLSVEFGDYGADAPDILTLTAYSGAGGTGSILDTDSVSFLALAFPGFATGSVAASGIRSVVMIAGTSGFPHSAFYDNVLVNAPVPEPGTFALMGFGLALAGVATRRRSRS